jgi:hypothetical protein
MIDLAQDCLASLKMAPSEITPEAIAADTIERLKRETTFLARAIWSK